MRAESYGSHDKDHAGGFEQGFICRMRAFKWQHDGTLRISVHGNREPSLFIESYEPGLGRVAISEGHSHLAKV